jgi:hypothetical protein
MASPKEFNLSKHAFERLLERDKDFFLSLQALCSLKGVFQ